MQGKSINGFTLQRLLGTGGMAEVWYAENEIGMKAAVKILNEKLSHDDQMQERFLNEAKVMVKLDHPNIRKVYGYGNIDGRPTIIMEYLDGSDLKARMKRGQRFTEEELERWWNQLVEALNYTHQKGIVHRDIKPGNIFVDSEGNIKLLDFGIAKVRESISSTQTGQKLGTLMYMSPEQVKDSKHIDYKTDVYSLAVTFVHLLTGKKPYDSDTSSDFEISEQIVYKPLDMSDVPAEWQGFLAPYLEKSPEKRPELRRFTLVEDDATKVDGDESESFETEEGVATSGFTWDPIFGMRQTTVTEDVDGDAGQISEKEPEMMEEETLVEGAEAKSVASKPRQEPERMKTQNSESSGEKPKKKTGLWIGLGVAAVVALVVILAKPKKEVDVSVSGSAGGHDYVDLGLPSGTLWATCNIGAILSGGSGDYYAWGETEPQASNNYDWDSYKYANGSIDKLTKYCSKSISGDNGYVDNLTTLQTDDDPAVSNWGTGWCTPNKAQWDELLSNTTNQWTTINGASGKLFTSKKNGKTLFLPAAGYRGSGKLNTIGSYGTYWSSSFDDSRLRGGAWYFYFGSGDAYMAYGYRYYGRSVRAVRSSRQN